MKKILSMMKFACDCLVAFAMRKEESFLEPEVAPDADAEVVAENLPARVPEKQVPWASIAAGAAVGLTAVTALAVLKKGKKKK